MTDCGMIEILGDVTAGGLLTLRKRMDSMYPHRTHAVRGQEEDYLRKEARRRFPWCPKNLPVLFCQAKDYHHYLVIDLEIPDHVRALAIGETWSAAENSRCACGHPGSWEHPVYGTSGIQSCVWAGCPRCPGQAIGAPLTKESFSFYARSPKNRRRL